MAEFSYINSGEFITLTEEDIRKLRDGERVVMVNEESAIIIELDSQKN